MNRNEIILSNLISARSAYIQYTDSLTQALQSSAAAQIAILTSGQIAYLAYQVYLSAALNALSQVDLCGDDIQSNAWIACVTEELQEQYGVKVGNVTEFYAGIGRNPALNNYNLVLSYIRAAVKILAEALYTLMITSLEECQQWAQANNEDFNIDIDAFRAWTPAQTFSNVFNKEAVNGINIDIRFDFTKPYASTSTGIDGAPRLYLTNSTFLDSNDILYSEDTVVGVICHEFGHAFANFLGTSSVAREMTSRPFNENGQPTDYVITVGGGSSGEPNISEVYLRATNSYYSGLNPDLGDWFRTGGYDYQDAEVCAATNSNYGEISACSGGCSHSDFLVDRNKHCISDGNNQCIPNEVCIPADPAIRDLAVYIRLPGIYIPEYSEEFEQSSGYEFFSNERGDTTENSAPKEGVADVFKVAVTTGGIERLLENEPRRLFWEQNRARWIFQLLSAFIPPNEVSPCLEGLG